MNSAPTELENALVKWAGFESDINNTRSRIQLLQQKAESLEKYKQDEERIINGFALVKER